MTRLQPYLVRLWQQSRAQPFISAQMAMMEHLVPWFSYATSEGGYTVLMMPNTWQMHSRS
ncbi:hypothetical protein AW15_03855 [Aeromonas sp. HZM]|nr:hypothetical protein AW15_03855 [Aeromonas sp. HZM]